MAFQIVKAQRKKAKLRLGICGASGSGKSYSALLMAYGITKEWASIGVIDTERRSAHLYSHLCGTEEPYGVIELGPPYSPERYAEAIHAFEQAGYKAIIVDSLSHAWEMEGGVMDQVDSLRVGKYRGDSKQAWRDMTPQHNHMVDALLQSPCHVIVTMRSKVEYDWNAVDEKGKKTVKKIAMAPIQRPGLDYEFTVVIDIDRERHLATASKDRTGVFGDKCFTPTSQTGQQLLDWLNDAPDDDSQVQQQTQPLQESLPKPMLPEGWETAIEQKLALKDINDLMKQAGIAPEQAAEFAQKITGRTTSSKELTKDQLEQLKQAIESYKPITFDDLDLDAGNVDDMFPSTSMGAAQ